MAKVEPRVEKRAAGATETEPKPTNEAEIKGKLVEFIWWMKKQGYAESTIAQAATDLKILVKRGANLLDPDSVKETIAKQHWADSRKSKVTATYDLFVKKNGLTWEKPKYKPKGKIPFIPTEKEIDDLIAGCGKKLAAFLQLLKETGMRSGEAENLEWTDVDFERKVVRITAEKHSNPRILPISSKCVAMLKMLPKKDRRIFGNLAPNSLRTGFMQQRKRLARKLNNPRLLQIHFHTLRHWKATMLYHQTKDPFFVKEFLGHKKLETILIYVHIEQALFKEHEDEFLCKVAKTVEGGKRLIEVGFEYVCDFHGAKLFRKRK